MDSQQQQLVAQYLENQQVMQQDIKTLSGVVIKLTTIQELHAELLKTLADERLVNATYKGKVGGIVLATMVGVSALWAAIIGAYEMMKGP